MSLFFLSSCFFQISHASDLEIKKKLEKVRDAFGKCLIESQVGLQSVFNTSVSTCEEEVKKKFPEMNRYQIVMEDPYKKSIDGVSHSGIFHKTGNLISVQIFVEAQEVRGKGKDQKIVALERSGPVTHTFNVMPDDGFCSKCKSFEKKSEMESVKDTANKVLTKLEQLTNFMSADMKLCKQGIIVIGLQKDSEGCRNKCEFGSIEEYTGGCKSCEELYNLYGAAKNSFLGKAAPSEFNSFANHCTDNHGCNFSETWNEKTLQCHRDCSVGEYLDKSDRCIQRTDYCSQKLQFYETTTKYERPPFALELEHLGCNVEKLLSVLKEIFVNDLNKVFRKCSDSSDLGGGMGFDTPHINSAEFFVLNCEAQTGRDVKRNEIMAKYPKYQYPQISVSY